MRLTVCLLAALLGVMAPRNAGAQAPPQGDVERARDLFIDGLEQRDKGDVRGALDKLRAAHALAVNPVTTFELARTYALLGMLIEARDAYASIAHLPARPGETERAAAARRDAPKAAEEIRPRIPTLSVKVDLAGSALSITLDGAAVPAALLAPPRPVDPGVHHLVATVPGGERIEQEITVKEREAREAEILVPPAPVPWQQPPGGATQPPGPPPPPPPPESVPPPAPRTSGPRFGPLAYLGFGVGAAGFLTGTVLAGATLSKASSIQCTEASCRQDSQDAAGAARDLGIAAIASYCVSAAGVALGVADLLLHKPEPAATGATLPAVRPWIGAGAAGLSGSF